MSGGIRGEKAVAVGGYWQKLWDIPQMKFVNCNSNAEIRFGFFFLSNFNVLDRFIFHRYCECDKVASAATLLNLHRKHKETKVNKTRKRNQGLYIN
jgi:hypothetical protein